MRVNIINELNVDDAVVYRLVNLDPAALIAEIVNIHFGNLRKESG